MNPKLGADEFWRYFEDFTTLAWRWEAQPTYTMPSERENVANFARLFDVPRSVRTVKTPLAAYTRCPRMCDCTALVSPDGHRWRPPEGHIWDVTPAIGRGWRRTGISWHSIGS